MSGFPFKHFINKWGGWQFALLVSTILHLLVFAWFLVGVEATPAVKVKPRAPGKPVIAEAVDPQWAEQELAKMAQRKLQKQQALEAERNRVKQLEQEKAREQAARKAAERKKQETERALAAAKKQEAARAAKEKQLQQEKARQAALKKQQQLEEVRAREEAARAQQEREAKAEQARLEREKARAEAEQKRQQEEAKAAEAQRQQQERQRAQEALQAQIDQEQRILDQNLVEQHILAIQARVAGSWLRPLNWDKQASCDVAVKLIPGGEVIAAQVMGSCGSAVFDRSVEAAVVKASPLPVPADPRLFNDNFRSFTFVFRDE